jgi:hypothetical protein
MNKYIETEKKRSIGKGTKRTSQENEFFFLGHPNCFEPGLSLLL